MSSECESAPEGQPDLDCQAVLADVYLLLDHECDEDTRAKLRHHMEHCAPCIEAYGVEEKLKELLSRKCGGDRAPDSLRERLTLQIRQSISKQCPDGQPPDPRASAAPTSGGDQEP